MIPENEIILASVSSIEGRKIKKYLGLVASETIIGSNIVKDFFSTFRQKNCDNNLAWTLSVFAKTRQPDETRSNL